MKADPILDFERLQDIAEYLRIRNERDYVLLWMGVYTGLRIQDMLDLRIRDLKSDGGKIKEFIFVKEGKTNKPRRIEMNRKLRRIIEVYAENKPSYEFMFKSRKGLNNPISRQQAYNILKEAGEVFGVRVSPHSLRKTFGRTLFELSNNDITVPMEALQHTTPAQTRRYIGITETVVNSYIQRLDFG